MAYVFELLCYFYLRVKLRKPAFIENCVRFLPSTGIEPLSSFPLAETCFYHSGQVFRAGLIKLFSNAHLLFGHLSITVSSGFVLKMSICIWAELRTEKTVHNNDLQTSTSMVFFFFLSSILHFAREIKNRYNLLQFFPSIIEFNLHILIITVLEVDLCN